MLTTHISWPVALRRSITVSPLTSNTAEIKIKLQRNHTNRPRLGKVY